MMTAVSNTTIQPASAAHPGPLVRFGSILAVLLFATACVSQGSELKRPALEPLTGGPSQAVASPDYAASQNGLTWIVEGHLSERGDKLYQALLRAETSGVCSSSYGVAEIGNLLAQGSQTKLATADTLLTEGLVRYASDVVGRQPHDRTALVEAASQAEDIRRFLAGLVPVDPAYRRLRSALDYYSALSNSGGWRRLPAGSSLKPGMVHSHIVDLRSRLSLTRDIGASTPLSPVFDADLEAAVRRFQFRNGLVVDGIVGTETRAALNVPADERTAAIVRNLCRYPDVMAKQRETAIVVNVPAAELHYFRGGALMFSSRVIVGRADWPTPIISDAVSAIELNPFWNIPPRIAQLEVIPKIIKDPGYLQARNIRVFSTGQASPRELDPVKIDWTSVRAGALPFRLRQDPGPQNAMGRVKFRLGNPYHIFLHDTPARKLFESSKRSLSHGCVRVQGALQLAKLILETHSDMPPKGVEQVLEDGAPVTIRLREPLPVHLVVISAWVDKDGIVHFREDPGRDLVEKSCIESLNTVAASNCSEPQCRY